MRPPIQTHGYHFLFFLLCFFINHQETGVPLRAKQPEYLDFSSKNKEIENSFKNEHQQKNILFPYKNTKNWFSLTHTTYSQTLINQNLPRFFYDFE